MAGGPRTRSTQNSAAPVAFALSRARSARFVCLSRYLHYTPLAEHVNGMRGAGGLGQQLDNSMKMFNGGEVASMLLVFVALVALADRVSAWLRKTLG